MMLTRLNQISPLNFKVQGKIRRGTSIEDAHHCVKRLLIGAGRKIDHGHLIGIHAHWYDDDVKSCFPGSGMEKDFGVKIFYMYTLRYVCMVMKDWL